MLSVIRNGKFTGIQYPQITSNRVKHHKKQGETLVLVDRTVEKGEEPTEEDLENEITDAPDLRQIAKEVEDIKRGAGVGQEGERGIAQRLDSLEDRIAELEQKI